VFNIICRLVVSLGVAFNVLVFGATFGVAFIIHVFVDAFHVFMFGVTPDIVVIDLEVAPYGNANVFNYI
jgi:hypothetical protein